MRRAAKTDRNHQQIVTGLRGIGAVVYYIKEPLDLLVGFRGNTTLLELKDGEKSASQKKLRPSQEKFFRTWNGGPAVVVENLEEAFRAITQPPK